MAVLPTEKAFDRISRAVRRVEGSMPGLAGELAGPRPGDLETTFCRVTSATVDGNGNYPAVITVYDPSVPGWSDYSAVKLKAPNGEALASGTRYPARPAGLLGSDELYVVTDTPAGGSLTVKDLLTPDVYSGVTELDYYEDWHKLSAPAAGRLLNQFLPQKVAIASFGTDRDPLTLPSRAAVYTLDCSADGKKIVRITPLDNEQVAWFVNVGGYPIYFVNQTGTANQISIPNLPLGAATRWLTLLPGDTIGLWYDSASTFWRVFAYPWGPVKANLRVAGGNLAGYADDAASLLITRSSLAVAEANSSSSSGSHTFTKTLVTQHPGFVALGGAFGATIHGITNPSEGRVFRIINAAAVTHTLKHDSATASAASERFYLPGGVDYTFTQYQGVTLIYSASLSRWLLADK